MMRRSARLIAGFIAAAVLGGMLVGCSQPARLEAKCLAGEPVRCTQLGEMYASGTGGVTRNLTKAAELFEKACAIDAPDVCNTLGELYESSSAIEGGIARAEQLFAKACNGGSSAGCLNLGLVLLAREEKQAAFVLFEKSCAGGWAAGCHQTGLGLEQGEGVGKDVVKAVGYYGQACDGGHVDGCLAAADLYAKGEALPRNIDAAVRLYGQAVKIHAEGCEAGSERDCLEANRIRTRMALAVSQSGGQPSPGAR